MIAEKNSAATSAASVRHDFPAVRGYDCSFAIVESLLKRTLRSTAPGANYHVYQEICKRKSMGRKTKRSLYSIFTTVRIGWIKLRPFGLESALYPERCGRVPQPSEEVSWRVAARKQRLAIAQN